VKSKYFVLYARSDPETYQQVMTYAIQNQVSQGEAIRRIIEIGLETIRLSEPSEALQLSSKRDRVHPSSSSFKLQHR
jgi:hypothetical protein